MHHSFALYVFQLNKRLCFPIYFIIEDLKKDGLFRGGNGIQGVDTGSLGICKVGGVGFRVGGICEPL